MGRFFLRGAGKSGVFEQEMGKGFFYLWREGSCAKVVPDAHRVERDWDEVGGVILAIASPPRAAGYMGEYPRSLRASTVRNST